VLLGGSHVHHENGDGAAGMLLFYFSGRAGVVLRGCWF
jgi:hypothetical protein